MHPTPAVDEHLKFDISLARTRAGSRVGRLLRGSLTDLLFVAIIVWLFAADPAGWDRLVWDGDVALHTRTGDFILDNGVVPKGDVFSFTMPGERWITFQWLTGVAFALLNRWAGLKAIVLLCGVLIGLYHVILLRDMMRRGVNGLVAILLVLFGCNAAAIHYHARPHLWTLVFLAVAGVLISSDRARPGRAFWALVPLTVLWANLHSGFAVLIALLGLLAVGSGISAMLGDQPWATARRYALATALCGFASLINPNGWDLHKHVLEFVSSSWARAHISEYQPPVFNSEPMAYFVMLLILGGGCCVGFLRRRQWTECLWIAFFSYSALTSARHIPLFLVVAIPLIGVAVTEQWKRYAMRAGRRSVMAILNDQAEMMTARLQPLGVWSAAAVGAILVMTPALSWPGDLSAKYFPRDMVRSHADDLAASRVFTTDQWGDYLLWVNYPRQRVFIDGRSDFFGEKLGDEYIKVTDAAAGWQAVLSKYRVDRALVAPDTALARAMEKEPGWSVVARDKASVLFTKTGSGASGL